MRVLRIIGKVLLALAVPLFGLVLVVSLPLGLYQLLGFLFKEVELLLFLPGFAIYLLLFCAPIGLVHWQRGLRGRPSGPPRFPSVALLAVGAAGSIVVGQALLLTMRGANSLFWVCFVLAAALPPITALAIALQRLGPIVSWRRLMAGWLSGSLISTHLTILLGAGVTALAYLLVLPLRQLAANLVASPGLERLFFSPALAVALVHGAVVAPLVEELTKPLAAILLARRLRGPGEAFLVGMAGGVGFAIVENMLYEAAGARLWAHIALVRGVGGVLHPLNAGLVAVGWYYLRQGQPGAWSRLVGLYGLAVGIHALWNGGLAVLFSGIGAYFFGADSWKMDVYGIGQPGVVGIYLLLLAVGMWRLLLVVTDRLRDPARGEIETALALHLEQPRRLALWAAGLLLVIGAIGALYGPLLAKYGSKLVPVG